MRRKIETLAGGFTVRILLALIFGSAATLLGGLSLRPVTKTLETPANGNWSIVHSANMTLQLLLGVACASQTDCWAVGYAFNDKNVRQPLTEHWNGGSWTIVPSASVDPTITNRLVDVACASGSDCWAVGYIGIS